jgi:hypothetical protein
MNSPLPSWQTALELQTAFYFFILAQIYRTCYGIFVFMFVVQQAPPNTLFDFQAKTHLRDLEIRTVLIQTALFRRWHYAHCDGLQKLRSIWVSTQLPSGGETLA